MPQYFLHLTSHAYALLVAHMEKDHPDPCSQKKLTSRLIITGPHGSAESFRDNDTVLRFSDQVERVNDMICTLAAVLFHPSICLACVYRPPAAGSGCHN